MSLNTYFYGGASNTVVERKAVSDSGGLAPVHRGASSFDKVSFTTLPQVKEKKRPQCGLSFLFGNSSTQYPQPNPADSEEFLEIDIWEWIEGFSSHPVAETRPVYKAPSNLEASSSIFVQASVPVDIPGCWSNVPNMMEAPEWGDLEWIPPHVYLRRKRHAYTGMPWSFSMHVGIGRVLSGRHAIEFRDAMLKMTGFYET